MRGEIRRLYAQTRYATNAFTGFIRQVRKITSLFVIFFILRRVFLDITQAIEGVVQKALELQQGLNEHGKLVFVNSRCPVMGNEIDPAKVTPALTRTYKGRKVAFCCAGCLPQWEKLTEDQKEGKLKALAPAKAKHDPDDGGDHSGHVH